MAVPIDRSPASETRNDDSLVGRTSQVDYDGAARRMVGMSRVGFRADKPVIWMAGTTEMDLSTSPSAEVLGVVPTDFKVVGIAAFVTTSPDNDAQIQVRDNGGTNIATATISSSVSANTFHQFDVDQDNSATVIDIANDGNATSGNAYIGVLIVPQ